MRVVVLWMVLLALPAAAVCWHWNLLGGAADLGAPLLPGQSPADQLVIEVGGQAPSLRGANLLAARPREPDPSPLPARPDGVEGGTSTGPAVASEEAGVKNRVRVVAADREAVKTPARTPPAKDPPAKEPLRTAVVADGETLYRIAGRELGDPSRWREIARLNRIGEASVARLKAGSRLELPRR